MTHPQPRQGARRVSFRRVRTAVVSCAALAALAMFPGEVCAHPLPVQTQDTEADAPAAAGGLDMAEMLKAMELAQPGPEHRELATLVGEWTSKVQLSMAPGLPAVEETSTATNRMIVGGRFLEIHALGTLMGMPFEGTSIIGFDRRRDEYNMVGMDTMGTYWITGVGKRDADGIIRMHGSDPDPNGEQAYILEYEILGPDAFKERVLFTQIGDRVYDPPFAMVTILNTRKDVVGRFEKMERGAPSVLDAGRVARGEELTAAVVETACGECQFDLPGNGCDLAVRIGEIAWFVEGTKIDDHGDAHAADGFCNAVRLARVSGHVEDDLFVVTAYELVPDSVHGKDEP